MEMGVRNASEKGATVIATIDAARSGIKRRIARRGQRRKRNDDREAKKRGLRKTKNWIPVFFGPLSETLPR